MKHIVRVAMLGLLLAPALLTSCEKEGDDYTLEGNAPQTSFTTSIKTTEFPTTVTFTNTSKDAFLYQWDFGDGSPLAKGQNVTHVYKRPGTYQVKLLTAGRGGTGQPQTANVVIAAPTSQAYVGLTNSTTTGNRAWILSNQAGAITKYAANGTTVLSSSEAGGVPACQADDEVTFTSTYAFSYSAGDETFADGVCGTAKTGSSDFVFTPIGTDGGKITLQKEGAFIGETTPTKDRSYEIVEVTATTLKLRTENADGTFTQYTFRPQLSALDRVKLLLTGNTSKTWMLQNDVDAPIVVGTEDDADAYFPGVKKGELPACQSDDEYTFFANDKFTYNAKDQTFVAGPYECQAPRTGGSDYAFGPADGKGIAMIEFKKAGTFIGVTDAPDLTYRIISISETNMVLRAGRPDPTNKDKALFEMKFVAKP